MIGAPVDTQPVLVVEDDAPTREFLRAILRAAGHPVHVVPDGLDALRYLETHAPPAAVVLDLGLPRLHGRDVHAEIEASGLAARIPVIVITGSPEAINDNEFACVLRKPLQADELLAAIYQGLRQRRIIS